MPRGINAGSSPSLGEPDRGGLIAVGPRHVPRHRRSFVLAAEVGGALGHATSTDGERPLSLESFFFRRSTTISPHGDVGFRFGFRGERNAVRPAPAGPDGADAGDGFVRNVRRVVVVRSGRAGPVPVRPGPTPDRTGRTAAVRTSVPSRYRTYRYESFGFGFVRSTVGRYGYGYVSYSSSGPVRPTVVSNVKV